MPYSRRAKGRNIGECYIVEGQGKSMPYSGRAKGRGYIVEGRGKSTSEGKGQREETSENAI
jgi:hypothetical protein